MIPRTLQAPMVACALSLAISACGGDSGTDPPPPIDYDAINPIVYTQHVQPILDQSCNTAACHNAVDRAFGLNLASYADVAAGGRYGATVLPFRPDESHLYLHINGALEPRMPLSRDPLDDAVIRFFRRWIAQGAPDDAGTPMYDHVTAKAFVACQGENEVAVLDLATGLYIRAIGVDAPHSVYVDVPNRRVFVSRFEDATDNIHVYDADTLELIDSGRAGTFPALMRMTPDGTQLWVTNFDTSPTGDNSVRVLNPDTLEEIAALLPPNQQQPHGVAVTSDGSTVYVTNILSDNLTVFCTACGSGDPDIIAFDVQLPALGRAVHQPQQCVLAKDEKRLFVSALTSGYVYVLNTDAADLDYLTFTAEVRVGDGPWNLAVSPDGNELWVANWASETVSVVNVSNPDAPIVAATLDPTHPFDTLRRILERPIGIAFSPDGSRVWVACANDDGAGSGHHPPPEGERAPGNVVVFDRLSRTVVSVTEVPFFARFVGFMP